MVKQGISYLRAKVYKYAFCLCAIVWGNKRKNIQGGEGVLIIEGGHIGDLLTDASALYAMIAHYQNAGEKVYFLCSPPLWNMLLRVYDLQGVEYVGGAFSYDTNHYEDIGKVLGQFKKQAFKIVIGIHNADSRIHCLIASLYAGQKWGVISKYPLQGLKGKMKRLIYKSYTNVILGDRCQFQLRYLESLLYELHVEPYQAQNVSIPKREKVQIPSRPYITIAVDSAATIRRWDVKNFIDLIHRLLIEFDMAIYLIGTSISSDAREQLDKAFRSEGEKVINLVGKMSMSEWIEWIRGSRFLVGVDSGSIHVAAAVGTPSFCLTGVWSSYKSLPYDVDVVVPGTVLPTCIDRRDTDVDQLPCFDCNGRGGPGASCNVECALQVKAGGPYLCLSKITPDDVLEVIRQTVVAPIKDSD